MAMSQGAIRTSLWPSSVKAAIAKTNERRAEHLTNIGRADAIHSPLDDAIDLEQAAADAIRRRIRRTRNAAKAKELWRELATHTDRTLELRRQRAALSHRN